MFEWDEAKRLSNLKKHGVDFADALEFDWEGAITVPDARFDYGEERRTALGKFRGHVHSVAYVIRREQRRLISFRRASSRETLRYDAEKKARS